MIFVFLALILVVLGILELIIRCFVSPKVVLKGKNVLISGGSEGIGFEIAQRVLKEGAKNVVLLARRENVLRIAQESLVKCEGQKVYILTCDVTDKEKVRQVPMELEKRFGIKNLDILIINQGMAMPGYCMEQDEDCYEKQMNVNYFGGVYLTKAFLPSMYNRKDTHVLFVGSTMSFLSFVGYSSYAPTKYAIRAYAEALDNEFEGHPISFHIALPCDTKTPGHSIENQTKPKECQEISEGARLLSAKETAEKVIKGLKRGYFYIECDFVTGLLIMLGRGVGPRPTTFFELLKLLTFAIAGPFARYSLRSTSRKHCENRKKVFQSVSNK